MMSLPVLRAIGQVLRVNASSAGEEGEVHVVQVLRQDALNEGRLLAHRFELAERFVVIEQANILRRKVTVAEDVFQLAALEGAGAYDGYAKQVASMSSAGQNFSGGMFGSFSSSV